MFRYAAFRPWLHRRPFVGVTLSRRCITTFGVGVASAGISALVLSPTIRLDAPSPAEPDTVKDPATGIEFPSTLRIPSRFPLPTYTLLGVGVRKVCMPNFFNRFHLKFGPGVLFEHKGLFSRFLRRFDWSASSLFVTSILHVI